MSASMLLGAGYGVSQFSGLAAVQQMADHRSLGTMTATYQVISYTGSALPFLMTLAQRDRHLSPSRLLLILLGVAGAATVWLAHATAKGRPER